MRRVKAFIGGFDRPNLYLRVDNFKTEREKRDALVHRLRWADKPGIIYTGTRKAAEEISRALADEQVDALFYHAGMKATERHQVQERFMQGGAEVIVATNAFGMGVDKPDIRFVYHLDPPDSLESYYQEIGRAGRDGKRAEAVLFYRPEDIGAQAYKANQGKIETEMLERLATQIAAEGEPISPEELREEAGIPGRKLTSALQRLADAGATETLAGGEVRATRRKPRELLLRSTNTAARRTGNGLSRCARMRKPARAVGNGCCATWAMNIRGPATGVTIAKPRRARSPIRVPARAAKWFSGRLLSPQCVVYRHETRTKRQLFEFAEIEIRDRPPVHFFGPPVHDIQPIDRAAGWRLVG